MEGFNITACKYELSSRRMKRWSSTSGHDAISFARGMIPVKDIRRKLAVRPDLFLVGVVEKQIVGTIMAGYDGHRGWLNYLAVLPGFSAAGAVRLLVEEAERLLRLGGVSEN